MQYSSGIDSILDLFQVEKKNCILFPGPRNCLKCLKMSKNMEGRGLEDFCGGTSEVFDSFFGGMPKFNGAPRI